MPKWNKSSDWLPLDNAKAQVKFYELDLEYSRNYLAFVVRMRPRIPNKFYNKMLQIAKNDVWDSTTNLSNAKKKLIESQNLE